MAAPSQNFYGQRHNLSGTSIDSEALLDHRYSCSCAATFGLVPANFLPQRPTLLYACSTGLHSGTITRGSTSIAEYQQVEEHIRRGQC